MAVVNEQPAILELNRATVSVEAPHWSTLRDVELRLAAGQIVSVLADPISAAAPLVAAASGLALPLTGEARFHGHRWNERFPRVECRLRFEIGRVFAGTSWLNNLSVLENVTLACRHHAHRREREIEAEADGLARSLGLPQVPRGRPAHISAEVSRRCQWVRALLGGPRLLVVEKPLDDLPEESR